MQGGSNMQGGDHNFPIVFFLFQDIPTTSIRSKADVQGLMSNQQAMSLSTNDIVINKLTQILSYLRAGNRNKKKKRDKMLNAPYPITDNDKNQSSHSRPNKVTLHFYIKTYCPQSHILIIIKLNKLKHFRLMTSQFMKMSVIMFQQ